MDQTSSTKLRTLLSASLASPAGRWVFIRSFKITTNFCYDRTQPSQSTGHSVVAEPFSVPPGLSTAETLAQASPLLTRRLHWFYGLPCPSNPFTNQNSKHFS